ncbi:uncharacterized protein LOC133909808 [Phragmites australis]|uniref:uncharacterized protein LOC133909808 n=1 Tax=Phragmites australis TaxID=29695 RepID=UPI002D78DBC1|nr:uncharacterized protein LOC133909808 [Phragmites australis]
MSSRNRKYDSGYEKRKKKQRLEAAAQSQKGALDRFVMKESQFNSENQTAAANVDGVHSDDAKIAIEVEAHAAEIVQGDDTNIADEVSGHTDGVDLSLDRSPSTESNNDINTSFQPDIFDPRTWDALDLKMIDILVQKGPKRDLSIEKGPKDKLSRKFSAVSYTRVLSNGEKCDREWLVYSKELDRVFCFCCKLLRKGYGKGQLANEGFNDWYHLGTRLKEHETSTEHVMNMATWYDLRLRLQKNQTIDKVAQRKLQKERDHWRKVLFRIILIVKFLAEHNLAFRGSNSKLYQDSNGNFLGLIQMLAEFNPVIQQHVQRITNDEIHIHYLGPGIQNELINLIAAAIRSQIIGKVKEAKYFSVIFDCTPDASHQE